MTQTKREPSARSLMQRLRPFVRRDLKGRLISATVASLVIAGLAWFGISAFTQLDSAGAKQVRVELGLEGEHEVCTSATEVDGPQCTFDDRSQAATDEAWEREVRIRSAINQELGLRLAATRANFEEAKDLLDRQAFDFGNGRPAAGDVHLLELLELPDIAPLSWDPFYANGLALDRVSDAASYVPVRDGSPHRTKALLFAALDAALTQIEDHEQTLARQRAREAKPEVSQATLDRKATNLDLDLDPGRFELSLHARTWFQHGVAPELSRSAFNLANRYPNEFPLALQSDADLWQGGWDNDNAAALQKPTVRYRSPITAEARNRLAGTLFLSIAVFVLLLVSPVVTATATAREREAGTLPVLRMTGMSANDLALAMVVGPNVFALTLGSSLLLAGAALITLSTGPCALGVPLTLLAVLTVATHLTAIGLGDALGQRVNAMVVGGLLGVGILIPGLLGAGLATFNIAATGLLLGPLPAVLATVADLSHINHVGIYLGDDLTQTTLVYSLAMQMMLGFVCLSSWQRRVEQGWAPLFRPFEGIALALVSIGCSALTLLDINAHHQAQDFNALNLLTFLSSVFLLPVLAWLLVASLRRPARAKAVADTRETRRAFLRFQGFVLAAAALVGLTYNAVMHSSGLATDQSEIMWATLAQLLLAAETGVAVLLWASRRREGKLRVAFLGIAVVLTQLVAVFGTYGLEVEHVARTNRAASPLLLNAEVSPYWLGFLVLCWSAGLALIFTALLRRRDEKRAAEAAAASAFDEPDDDDDFGMPGRRLIH